MLDNDMVDHEARQSAALANQKIDAHEDRCAERWKEARDEMREGRSFQRWSLGGVIAAQFAIVMLLASVLL